MGTQLMILFGMPFTQRFVLVLTAFEILSVLIFSHCGKDVPHVNLFNFIELLEYAKYWCPSKLRKFQSLFLWIFCVLFSFFAILCELLCDNMPYGIAQDYYLWSCEVVFVSLMSSLPAFWLDNLSPSFSRPLVYFSACWTLLLVFTYAFFISVIAIFTSKISIWYLLIISVSLLILSGMKHHAHDFSSLIDLLKNVSVKMFEIIGLELLYKKSNVLAFSRTSFVDWLPSLCVWYILVFHKPHFFC